LDYLGFLHINFVIKTVNNCIAIAATFFPMASPTERLRGNYVEPPYAGGKGPFTVMPGDSSKIPSVPTPGYMLKETPGSTLIKGILIPSDGQSPVPVFKPDSDISSIGKEGTLRTFQPPSL
jgi:hypothetical protein